MLLTNKEERMPEDYHLFNSHQKRSFWAGHVSRWQQSGLSQSAYCRQHNLKAHRFYHWRRRILNPASEATFLPVALSEIQAQHQHAVRVHTPNGFTIELEIQSDIHEVNQLVAMVAAL